MNVSGLVKYDPMRASSYLPLPKELKAKKACLNIQNNDEKCFLWPILASLHSLQRRNNLDRVSKYQEYELSMSWIKYPVDIKDIGKFEHQSNITVNVGTKIKKSSRYVLLLWPLQDITWSYYIFLPRLFTWLYQWRGIEKPFGKM